MSDAPAHSCTLANRSPATPVLRYAFELLASPIAPAARARSVAGDACLPPLALLEKIKPAFPSYSTLPMERTRAPPSANTPVSLCAFPQPNFRGHAALRVVCLDSRTHCELSPVPPSNEWLPSPTDVPRTRISYCVKLASKWQAKKTGSCV